MNKKIALFSLILISFVKVSAAPQCVDYRMEKLPCNPGQGPTNISCEGPFKIRCASYITSEESRSNVFGRVVFAELEKLTPVSNTQGGVIVIVTESGDFGHAILEMVENAPTVTEYKILSYAGILLGVNNSKLRKANADEEAAALNIMKAYKNTEKPDFYWVLN